MKFLVDQNLPSTLAVRLAAEGQDAQHTSDLGMERTLDEDIFAWCRQNDAVLPTADKRLTKYLTSASHRRMSACSPLRLAARGTSLRSAHSGRVNTSRNSWLTKRSSLPTLTSLRSRASTRACSQDDAV